MFSLTQNWTNEDVVIHFLLENSPCHVDHQQLEQKEEFHFEYYRRICLRKISFSCIHQLRDVLEDSLSAKISQLQQLH